MDDMATPVLNVSLFPFVNLRHLLQLNRSSRKHQTAQTSPWNSVHRWGHVSLDEVMFSGGARKSHVPGTEFCGGSAHYFPLALFYSLSMVETRIEICPSVALK